MAKHQWQKQNWYRWNGNLWVNFHDYGHSNGSVLTIVRFREGGKGWVNPSTNTLGKYRTINGVEKKFRKDDLYKGENPDEWWDWERLVSLRKDLAGADYKANRTAVV